MGDSRKVAVTSSYNVRQNFHIDCEDGVNKLINVELCASYMYLSLSFNFDREDIAEAGFHKFFKHLSDERREEALKWSHYQNERGGRIILNDVEKPSKDDWGTGVDAMRDALTLEKKVNELLLELHASADRLNDPHLTNTLESEHLQKQVDIIIHLASHITNLERVGEGLGEYMFDKESLGR